MQSAPAEQKTTKFVVINGPSIMDILDTTRICEGRVFLSPTLNFSGYHSTEIEPDQYRSAVGSNTTVSLVLLGTGLVSEGQTTSIPVVLLRKKGSPLEAEIYWGVYKRQVGRMIRSILDCCTVAEFIEKNPGMDMLIPSEYRPD